MRILTALLPTAIFAGGVRLALNMCACWTARP